MTASPHILARLRALIALKGETPHSVSLKLGWAGGRVGAKLTAPLRADGSPNPDYRGCTLVEADEILGALGLRADLAGKATAAAEGAIDKIAIPS